MNTVPLVNTVDSCGRLPRNSYYAMTPKRFLHDTLNISIMKMRPRFLLINSGCLRALRTLLKKICENGNNK